MTLLSFYFIYFANQPSLMQIKKILMSKKGKAFCLKDVSKDFHTQFGYLKKKDLEAKDGEVLTTNLDKQLSIFSPSFIDIYSKIKRGAQIIPLKDIGAIFAQTGIDNTSKIVDAGAGSGALSCFLAHYAKEVTTYDIREDHLDIVKKNIVDLNLKNITTKHKNIYDGIDEKNVSLVTLDVPEPWNALDPVSTALKVGGFLVSYSPSIPQTTDFVNAVNARDEFAHLKTIEIIEREWEIQGRKVRPITTGIGHSGFLSFVRKTAAAKM